MDKTSSQSKEFLHYHLDADTLCLGERIRGSLFRPCISVFTYTALVGALKARFPYPYRSIHATGRFLNHNPSVNIREIMTFSPRDRGRETSVIPLEIEYLANVCAEVFVFKNDFTIKWPEKFTIHLGAMKSKGFGCCRLKLLDSVPCNAPQQGSLGVRLPEDGRNIMEVFNIKNVMSPIYGYLFRPDTGGIGHYVRSLFEGTKLVADPILFQQ